MLKIMGAFILGGMIYFTVMWAFMISDMHTGFSIPWLGKTVDKLASIGKVILLVYIIVLFILCAYGTVTDDPGFVGVYE